MKTTGWLCQERKQKGGPLLPGWQNQPASQAFHFLLPAWGIRQVCQTTSAGENPTRPTFPLGTGMVPTTRTSSGKESPGLPERNRPKPISRRTIALVLAGGLAGILLGATFCLPGWAGQPEARKSSSKNSPALPEPNQVQRVQANSVQQPRQENASAEEGSSSGKRVYRPWPRYYYYYYGPSWPGYPWPYPPPPPYPYYYYGPVFVPADVAGYGPRSILRLMGVEHWFSGPPAPGSEDRVGGHIQGQRGGHLPAEPAPAQPAPAKGPNAPEPPLILKGPAQEAGKGPPPGENPGGGMVPNPQRAMLLVDFGDAHFAHKKYAEALQRYREAVRLDPQLPEAHLHMGFTLVALGRYAEAAQSFKRGLQLNPNWPASGFRLSVLYGPQEAERVAHRDALAKAAAAKPNDPDLLFLLGLLFYFDQMPDQARRAFQEAARLLPENTPHIDPFLRRL